MNWEEFTKKLRFTTRTKETVEEYKNMTKDQQSNIKDVGGFVAGELKTADETIKAFYHVA